MKRRFPGLVLVVGALAAIVSVAREPVDATPPTFSISATGWMPSTVEREGITETWFCPGVPATGIDDVGGAVAIANRSGDQMVGTILLLNDAAETRRLDLSVDGWSTAVVDLDATLPGDVVGAVIEVEGGGAIVEQRAFHPSGDSSTACANATSDRWYLADGFTVEGSVDQVVLTNPFEQTVVVNLEFATTEGSRRPARYRGLTVPAQSVRVLDLGAPGLGAQSEPVLAVTVEATRGRLVVGRSQRYLGGGRLGTQVTLASPAVREQWWFANGVKGPGIAERFSIYNPTDDAIEVDVLFIGIQTPILVDPIEVPAHEVVTFDPGPLADLPEGRHATVFSTATNDPAIVVERAVTRSIDDVVGTSVIAGATPRQDGHVARTWHVASGPEEPTPDALVVYNADNTDGTVSISAVGSSGPVPVAGLQEILLPAAQLVTIDLVDPLVQGRELILTSTARVFVEQSFPTGRGGTRYATWAVPAG